MVQLVPLNEDPFADTPAGPRLEPLAEDPFAESIVPDWLSSALGTAGRYGAVTGAGAVRGATAIAGAPVDLVNFGLKQIGLGSDKPFGGSEMLHDLTLAPGAGVDLAAEALGYESPQLGQETLPQTPGERVAHRIGYEVGGTAVPVGGVIAAGALTAKPAINALIDSGSTFKGVIGQALDAGKRAPASLVKREAAYATAAGAGAGAANEAARGTGAEGEWDTDMAGSIAGMFGLAGASKAVSTAHGIVAPVVGSPDYVDNLVGGKVANEIIGRTGEYQNRPMTPGGKETGPFDTEALVDKFRTPAPVEEAIPGYRANLGDRTLDPELISLAYNVDGLQPGKAAVRRASNERVVNERVAELTPGGDPALFRDALETARTQTLQAVDAISAQAVARFDQMRQDLAPVMAESSARGSQARAALADAYERTRAEVDAAYARARDGRVRLDASDLAGRFQQVETGLPLNDQLRFTPTEADVPRQLVERFTQQRAADPEPPQSRARRTAEDEWDRLTGGEGNREVPPPPRATVPFDDVTSIRSGLTDTIREANAKPGGAQQSRIARMFLDETDQFIDQQLQTRPRLRERYEEARAARRDQADRFERPGDALTQILRTREGGDYALNDNAVTGKLLQPDRGRIDDFRAAVREAGQDHRLRDALQDELRADIDRRGLLNHPDRLRQYLRERNVVLAEFPDLARQLRDAGLAGDSAIAAREAAEATRDELTTPSRSPIAKYLQHSDVGTANAMQEIISSKDPVGGLNTLLDTAGRSPETLNNARAAFWTVVAKKKFSAKDATGTKRWNARELDDFFSDAKVDAVARELWSDNPQQLDELKELFSTLSGAEGSTRARAPGTSGTAQILKGGKYDASLSGASIASRFRAAQEGRTSVTYFWSSLLGDYMRRARTAAEGAAIDRVMAEAINNPDLAADLLQRYNPADLAAKKRLISQKYGARAATVVKVLGEIEDEGETDVTKAVKEKKQ